MQNKVISLNGHFQGADTHPSLQQLQSWKTKGYTDIVLFGRFQPFHRGHGALLETLRATNLNVHLVLNDKTDGAEGERNPFNTSQKREMVRRAVPWLSPETSVHEANVYLGGGGDVGNDVRKLTAIFERLSPPGKLVFAYFEKAEDRKKYLVDGQVYDGVHYVELVGAPRGPFPIQRITEDMLQTVAEYIPIDAKMFRAGIRKQDELCYELLKRDVASYISDQYELAARNGRAVGANPANDTFTMQDLMQEREAQNNAPVNNLDNLQWEFAS